MRQLNEVIVGFRRGVAEETARAAVEARGGSVKRRMRTDHEDEVMLLVKVDDTAALAKAMKSHADVTHVEINQDGFHI
ncbi:MAG: hypothetical protein RMA76_14160 [Deltaproteobacteria bacterium]